MALLHQGGTFGRGPSGGRRMVDFRPKRGHVLMCDFTFLEVPEMVKWRPVVVVSPRLARDPRLVTVVPVSTRESRLPYHPRLAAESLPPPFCRTPAWAKCDMLYTVSTARLDRIRDKQPDGRLRWHGKHFVTNNDMLLIQKGIFAALGLL